MVKRVDIYQHIAKEYGLTASILFSEISKELVYHIKNKLNFYYEKYWVKYSINSFQKKFPFLSIHQIRNAIDKMVNAGLLEKTFFNSEFDNTAYYTLNIYKYDEISLKHKDYFEKYKMEIN